MQWGGREGCRCGDQRLPLLNARSVCCQTIHVVGNHPALGCWSPAASTALMCAGTSSWSTPMPVSVPSGAAIEYKCAAPIRSPSHALASSTPPHPSFPSLSPPPRRRYLLFLDGHLERWEAFGGNRHVPRVVPPAAAGRPSVTYIDTFDALPSAPKPPPAPAAVPAPAAAPGSRVGSGSTVSRASSGGNVARVASGGRVAHNTSFPRSLSSSSNSSGGGQSSSGAGDRTNDSRAATITTTRRPAPPPSPAPAEHHPTGEYGNNTDFPTLGELDDTLGDLRPVGSRGRVASHGLGSQGHPAARAPPAVVVVSYILPLLITRRGERESNGNDEEGGADSTWHIEWNQDAVIAKKPRLSQQQQARTTTAPLLDTPHCRPPPSFGDFSSELPTICPRGAGGGPHGDVDWMPGRPRGEG